MDEHMDKRILITSSHGFIGTHRKNELTQRENTIQDLEPRIVYETSLGEVVDFIEKFKTNVNNQHYSISNTEFKHKLFETYKNYHRLIHIKE